MNFWNGKRVLVTGGYGFLGQRIVAELEKRGAHVIAVRKRECDLTDAIQCSRLFATQEPEIVIHAAGHVGGIGANQAKPADFFYDNMTMGLNVIYESNMTNSVEKLVIIGTTCSYPSHARTPFKECDLFTGYPEPTNAPYGIAKLALLVQAQAYREQYSLSSIYLIPANLFGPGDSEDHTKSHVIPAIISKMLEAVQTGAGTVTLWGTGTPTRDFLFVDDAARAIVDAAEQYDDPEPMNIGSGRAVSIAAIASMIAGICDFKGRIVWDDSKPDGQMRRLLDCSRAMEAIDYRPRGFRVEDLLATVNYYTSAVRA